jgi:hypothetical protein
MDKMGTKKVVWYEKNKRQMVWSRGIYLGDNWGDLETNGGIGLKV